MKFPRETVGGITVVWLDVPGELTEFDKEYVRERLRQRAEDAATEAAERQLTEYERQERREGDD